MKKILFITDSLGLPKYFPEKIYAEKTYPNITTKFFHDNHHKKYMFFQYRRAGLTTAFINYEINEGSLLAYKPDIIVLQVGIVDCYPRALTKIERAIMSRIPILNSFLKKIIKKYYKKIVQYRNISYINKKDFKSHIKNIKLNLFSSVNKTIVIPIAPANKNYKDLNPRVDENIKIYNDILRSVFKDNFYNTFYDSFLAEEMFLSDNHHLNNSGHKYFSKKLIEKISKI